MADPDIMQIIADGAKRQTNATTPAAHGPAAKAPEPRTTTAAASGADKRAAPRAVTAPDDYVILNGLQLPLRNWSAAGLLFGPMGTPPAIGQTIQIKVTVRCGDDRLKFEASGQVMRVANGQVAVRYRCASAETAARIKAYFERLAETTGPG